MPRLPTYLLVPPILPIHEKRNVVKKLFATALSFFACLSSVASAQPMEVVLRDGRQITVERTIQETSKLRFTDPFFGLPTIPRSERGGDITRLKFRNPDTNETITWKSEPHYTPVLLDIVAGVPYLVVNGVISKQTEAIYGCPELPYFYFKFESRFGEKWLLVPVEKAPVELRVSNLKIEGRNDAGFFQRVIPRTYEEWNYAYKKEHLNERKVWDCRPPRVAPPPDTVFENAIKRNIDANNNAKQVTASILSQTNISEKVTATEHSRAKGQWTGSGYLSQNCKGVVSSVQQIGKYDYDQSGGRTLVGSIIFVDEKKKLPVGQEVKTPAASGPQLQLVECAGGVIYAVTRSNKSNLVVHRFSYAGDVLDSMHVLIPETDKVIAGNNWGDLWDVSVGNGLLNFSLVNYSYTGTANQGGNISQRQTYSFKLQ